MNLNEYSIGVAEEFLQTAVFVDDRIFDNGRMAGEQKVPSLGKKLRVPARKSVKVVTPIVAPQEAPKALRCQDIVESFAKKKIVCSLYQMGKESGAGPTSNLYKLVSSADILIVDWDIEGDRGQKAMQLVSGLVKSSLENEPEQLRSIIIYTSEPNLKASVADKLFECLSELADSKIEIDLKAEDDGLAFHTKNSRITIFGKPGGVGRSEDFKKHEVVESALAERAIAEFSKLASGLLQGAALQGLALIRKNTRRILTMFGADLDAPFLLHRALSLPKEEAIRHLVPLLVAEMESVLEDEFDARMSDHEVLGGWCDLNVLPGTFPKEGAAKSVPQVEVAKELVRSGANVQRFLTDKKVPLRSSLFGESDDEGYSWNIRSKEGLELIESFLVAPEGAKMAQAKLTALMSQRTYYSKRRAMSLGSLLHDGKDYYLCVQPACDCVRLKGWSPFPLLKMEVSDSAFDVLVVDENEVVGLKSNFKPSSIFVFYFLAGGTSGTVEAKRAENVFSFQGGGAVRGPKRQFRWVTQLKVEQALRILGRISTQLGRVGLTESEWARLRSR